MFQTTKKPLARTLQGAFNIPTKSAISQLDLISSQLAGENTFLTNDSWFSQSDEPLAHAWQATARAVETGLPVVRVGNSGVTGTITPRGRAAWLVGPEGRPLVDRPGTMLDRIPVAGGLSPTLYVRLGDAPLAVAFGLLVVGLAGAALWGRRRI